MFDKSEPANPVVTINIPEARMFEVECLTGNSIHNLEVEGHDVLADGGGLTIVKYIRVSETGAMRRLQLLRAPGTWLSVRQISEDKEYVPPFLLSVN